SLGEPMKGAEAIPLAEPRVLPAVEQLERLDVELDVADPAHAQLDVALLLIARAQPPVDPILHRPDLAEGLALEAGAVDDLLRQIEDRLPPPLGARRHPGLDQRLALPQGAARSVVGAVRRQR